MLGTLTFCVCNVWGDVTHPSKQSRRKAIGSVTVPSSYLYIAVVKSIDAGPNLGMFP